MIDLPDSTEEPFDPLREEPRLKRLSRTVTLQVLAGILLIGLHVALHFSGAAERLESTVLDGFFHLRGKIPVNEGIVCIEIDEKSLQELGPWPWPGSIHAGLIRGLKQAGARVVVMDLSLKESEMTPEDQALLVEAVREHGHVFLPMSLVSLGDRLTWSRPALGLELSARGVGHVNFALDRDGVLRRIRPYVSDGTRSAAYLPLLAGFHFSGRDLLAQNSFPLPLDPQGNLIVNWAGRWQGSFQRYSYSEVFRAVEALQQGRVPKLSTDRFEAKICLIGMTASRFGDRVASPLEPAYPVLGIDASVINSVLTGRTIYPLSLAEGAAVVIGMGLAALFFFIPFRGMFSVGMMFFMAALWSGAAFAYFSLNDVWMPVLIPLMAIITLFGFAALSTLIFPTAEKEKLFLMATRDGLTGLWTMRYIRSILSEIVPKLRKTKESVAVILADVDHFKKVNDTYGHQAGDAVLRQVAEVLRTNLRGESTRVTSSDLIGRYGGEEFIVILRNTPAVHAAWQIGERLRAAVQKTLVEWEGQKIPIAISLGVSGIHPDEDTAEEAIRRADIALYRAKEKGRNQVCLGE